METTVTKTCTADPDVVREQFKDLADTIVKRCLIDHYKGQTDALTCEDCPIPGSEADKLCEAYKAAML